MNGLILCHGSAYQREKLRIKTKTGFKLIEACGTSGLTYRILKSFDTIDILDEAKPTIVHDLTKPLKTDKTYDIITTLCCPTGDILINKHGRLNTIFFTNIYRLLKKDRYFICTLSINATKVLFRQFSDAKKLNEYQKELHNKKPIPLSLLIKLQRSIEKERQKLYQVLIKKCLDASPAGTMFELVSVRKKNQLLKSWNKTDTIDPEWRELFVLKSRRPT